ncbi:MAG: holo-ACP synthase [Firmicutes bacterium]|nr:holo-ACP synthase [Bacillota bacterium]
MVYGIGIDHVEIARVRRAVGRRPRLLERLWTEEERATCRGRRDRYACLAARFAAKEAVLKALGTGLAGCRWRDVAVVLRAGRPQVVLSGRPAEVARGNGLEVLVSLSHDRRCAVAVAVTVRGEGKDVSGFGGGDAGAGPEDH